MSCCRRAGAGDVPALVGLAQRFHVPGQWSGLVGFCPESFARTCEHVISTGAVFLTEGGMIGLVLTPSPYNHSVRIAAELFFVAFDGRGAELLRAAELWAWDNGADLICTSAHVPGEPPERVARINQFYRRKGFLAMGHQYAKAVR